MKFALVNGLRAEAAPLLSGYCQCCNSPLIAKCGKVNVWHWAHKGNPPCDPWRENETPWHRAWKGTFPERWQEYVHKDVLTGEKHVADIKTEHGLVIEFQHSPIKQEEMAAREAFYGNMIWVVDGRRGENDRFYFHLGRKAVPTLFEYDICEIKWYARSKLLTNWSYATKPVYFDFGEDCLWKLVISARERNYYIVAAAGRESFAVECREGKEITHLQRITD